MSVRGILNAMTQKKSSDKKRRSKYITRKYNERSITNRLFK